MNEEFAKFILARNEFSNSGTAPILALLERSDRKTYPKNDFVYTPEHELKYVYIVDKGAVELFSYSPNRAQKKTFAVVNEGIIFGFGELSGKNHLLYAQAADKSVIIRIPIADFLDIVAADKALTLDFFRSFSYQICQFQRAELMENAQVKILNYLNWIVREQGRETVAGISVPRTQTYEEIGNLLFLTRETVIRTFQSLEKEGIITILKKEIILNSTDVLAEKRVILRKHFRVDD